MRMNLKARIMKIDHVALYCLNLEGMRLLGSDLFFPYQGDELEFGKDYFVFPMEDGEPLRLEWNGEQFVVAK